MPAFYDVATLLISLDLLIKRKYTVLKIQFWSVNYTLVARICKNVEQKEPCSRRKQYITVLKVNNHIAFVH